VTELERLFRRLVANLAASDPARLHRPIPLEDILESIVPYRSNRRALLLESAEDYELVVLRLCAGEGGLVRTEPEEVRARFAEEAASTNPDLRVLHKFEHVLVSIRSEPLARALDSEPDPGLPYPSHFETQALAGLDLPALDPLNDLDPNEPDASAEPDEVPMANPPHCLYCGDALPGDRPVRFCPHCGQRQAPSECPRCHSDVEPGWRHCVSCGTALADG
jgi:predicted RNA-binding Zn-ribbon protein involved in translation (DUF1610 family)